MSEAIVDLTEVLDRQKITGFNARLLLLTFLVTTTYGLEFGPTILAGSDFRWGWDESGAGYSVKLVLSLAAGCIAPLILGGLADCFGRRRIIVAAAFAFGLFALAAAIAMALMTVPRKQIVFPVTLIAVLLGGVLPILVSLINEFAPKRARATMVILMLSGIGFGGGLRMLFVLNFMQPYGLHIAPWIGGVAPLAVALALWSALPESAKYLASHPVRRDELIVLIKRIDNTLDVGDDARFVISSERNEPRFSLGALFAGPLAVLTPLYWILNFATLMVLSFVIEEMVQVLMASGLSSHKTFIAVMFIQFSGALGGLFAMRFFDKFGIWPVTILLACAVPILIGIDIDGFVPAALLGGTWFCLFGAQFGNIATEANIYPTHIRAFAVGTSFAAARIGSGLYWLLDDMDLRLYLHAWRMFALAATPLGVGIIAALLIAPRYLALLKRT
jgi:AAHS family 4-hydroxybenzoate transporter-like MFS transporter